MSYASFLSHLPARRALGASAPGVRTFLGSVPPATVQAFRGPKDTLDKMAEAALGARGEQSFLVRQFTEWLLRGVQPKDYLGEILAIRNVLVAPSPFVEGIALFRYVNDPRHVEMVKDPERQVTEIMEQGSTLVDCDDYSTMAATMALVIGRAVELVAMGFEPGSLSHVAVRIQEPKTKQWIVVDGGAGPREREAASKAKELMVRSLD
jgi:hypothetical protein